jgi:hypothetical protein
VGVGAAACGQAEQPVARGWQGQAATGAAPAARGLCVEANGAACATEAATVRVVAAGDISCAADDPDFNGGQGTATGCRMLATADVASALQPQDVLLLGDLQYGTPNLNGFLVSFDLNWGRFKTISHPAAGNHEYDVAGARGYFDYFGARAGTRGQGWYSYDLRGWHVVALNTNCNPAGGCTATSPQGQWLAADLAASTSPCTLAIAHHPRFSSSNEGDNLTMAPLWDALHAAGAELVLTGHQHNYERYAAMNAAGQLSPATGVTQIIVGTGGKSLDGFSVVKPTSQARIMAFGVLALDLRPGGYTWRFVDEHGTVLDSGSRNCHGRPA